jgi:cytochrome c-type biogenesis protein CcmH
VTAAFWILVTLFAVAALAFVLPALLARGGRKESPAGDAANIAIYRDQLRELDADLAAGTLMREQHDEARRELERRMLEDVGPGKNAAPAAEPGRGTALAVGVAVPLVAALLYFAVGNPQALAPRSAGGDGQGVTVQQIESMVERLAARMKENPDDAKGWVMLGRSYMVLDRFPEAVDAYANAVQRSPPDAQLLVDYADAIAMARGRRLEGEPERLIAQALKLDPDNVKALLLAGTVAFQKKDFRGAIAHWERILKVVPPDSDIADSIRDGIADARKLAEGKPAPAPKAAGSAPATVSGTVRLAPGVSAKAAPDDTVFIFARAVAGPRIPLAVTKKRVRDLPVAFKLDDSMAMSPAARLSDHAQVVIGARVSKSGNPVAQPGDLEGLSAPLKTGTSGITITIDREIPAGK